MLTGFSLGAVVEWREGFWRSETLRGRAGRLRQASESADDV